MNAFAEFVPSAPTRCAQFAGLVFSVPGCLGVLQAIHVADQSPHCPPAEPDAKPLYVSNMGNPWQCPIKKIFSFCLSQTKKPHAANSLARALSSFTTPNGLWTYTLVPWED